MAVDQSLIEGAKDLLYQDYLDINVPMTSAQAASIGKGLLEAGSNLKSKFQGIGNAFKGLGRGGGESPMLEVKEKNGRISYYHLVKLPSDSSW